MLGNSILEKSVYCISDVEVPFLYIIVHELNVAGCAQKFTLLHQFVLS